VSATDARGQTLAYDYDNLGRKIGEYSGSVTGTKLASWTWDTLQAGHLSSETRYTTAGNYVTGTTSYDGMGNAMGQYVTLPFQETGLKGTWTTGYSYSSTGQILTMGPAPVAGVPAETVTNTYDALGIPTKVAGSSIVASQTLNGYALPGQITYGGSSNNAWENFTYDVQTLKPTDIALTAQLATAQVDDTKYTYDPAGSPTRISDTQGPVGSSPVDDQCFTYDALSRLSAAWTATDACAGAPNNAATGGNIGGPAPYWQSWTFNPDGTRNTQTIHALPGASGGDSTTTYGYGTVASSCAAGSANPAHGLDTTSSPGGGAAYCYDANGETTSRPDASGTGTQTLTWDAEGKLQKDVGAAGTTTWVNDADGNEVVRHDPGSTTLYLPGQEITRAANGTVTTIRSYSLGTIVVGESTGQAATTEYVYGDQHGTNQIAVNTTTLAVTRRALDPYGNPRGTVTGGTWPDHRGFLGKPTSTTTGLTDIGAREYDPVAGRFLSVDPLLETDDQRQMNGYCYGADNPVAGSDPTGKNWFSNTWDDFYSSVKDTVSTSISSSYHYFDNVGKDLSHCWGGNMWRCGQGAFNATPPGWLWNAGNGIWNSTNNFAGSCATGMYSTCAGNTLGLAASCAELLGCLGQPGGGFKGTKNIPGLSTDKWTNGPDTNPDLDTSKIEHALGGNLPPNFSVFDKWDPDTGTATSIKTIDWRYKSYAKPGAILSMGKGYVNDLVNFWAGTNTAQSQDKSIRITTDDVDTTVMNLAFPADGVTNDQLQAYQRIATYGYYKGITVNLIPVTTS
jgi:RHS repeat-associated protein